MTTYDPVLTEAPAVLPVSVAECKQHLRIDGSDEDGLVEIYLNAAVAHLDGDAGWLGRAIVAQTWSQDFDAFAPSILLGLAPVTAIESITYQDAGDVQQTVDEDDYTLVNGANTPEVRFDVDFVPPVTRIDKPVLTVTFVGGYGDDAAAPAPIKVAILLMVGDMYANREGKVGNDLMDNAVVRRLLDPYRRGWVA
jgi:uncharacterized phiE125 gp8 family phage protein